MSEFRTVSIIGGGTMGSGIARMLRIKNVENRVFKVRDLHHLNVSDIDYLGNSDLIIECGPENFDRKREIIQLIGTINPLCVLGTCTSSISLNLLAGIAPSPSNFVGIHFMNPPISIPFVEVVSSDLTSNTCLSRTRNWLHEIGMNAVAVPDIPGFVLNSILFAMLNKAAYVFESAGLEARELDLLMTGVAGFQMGPLATLDYVGLDVARLIIDNMHNDDPNSNFPTSRAIVDLVEVNQLGRKTGRGFFEY